jgi:GTP cyclohydrolase I
MNYSEETNMSHDQDVEEQEFSERDWRRLLKHIGEDPLRQGLHETPQRVERAWQHWTTGYGQNPAEILKVFEDGAQQYNELVIVKGIPVYRAPRKIYGHPPFCKGRFWVL